MTDFNTQTNSGEPQPIQPSPDPAPSPLVYEETPVITPQVDTTPVSPEQTPVTPQSHTAFHTLKIVALFLVLFAIGFALSGVVRNLINRPVTQKTQQTAVSATPTSVPSPAAASIQVTATPSGTISVSPTILPSITPSVTGWTVYSVMNGKTRTSIPGLTFQLPTGVSAPTCDGVSCGSQGTYLPGGTRLTVAARGTGQVLADFRGKTITDANGKALITTATTVGGKQAMEFKTDTTGSTNGGYGFTAMHGYMIIISDTMSLEINHFSPAGIKTDFSTDETVFSSIVTTITFPTNGTASSMQSITPAPTYKGTLPTATPTTTAVNPIR